LADNINLAQEEIKDAKDEGPQEKKEEIQRLDAEGPAIYPSKEYFLKYKDNLNIPNIKASITHTYNKALQLRSQMMENQEGGLGPN
jgi:hypothetical protein